MLHRRRFIALLGSLGLGMLAGKAAPAEEKTTDYYPLLSEVIAEQNRRNNSEFTEREREHLRYACDAIRPSTHAELAFIAAVGPKWAPCQDLVDEYVRRRAGNAAAIEDHPVFALDEWGMPETCRIPVYREQHVMLVRELTDMTQRESIGLLYRYLRYSPDKPPLRTMAIEKYRDTLSAGDFARIERIIRFYLPRAMPYAWCSAMAGRAEAWERRREGKA